MKQCSKDELQQIVVSCKRWSDVCRALELNPTGGNYAIVKKLIADNNIDISHFKKEPWNKGLSIKCEDYYQWQLKDLLIENSPHKNTNKLKHRLFKEGLKQMKCEKCGLIDSNILELHHINGNSTDNRLENLQILCPNCHSKTDNFRGKNISFRTHKDPSELILTEEEVLERKQKRLEKRRVPIEQRKIKLLEERNCPNCDIKFKPKDKSQKYCGRECYRVANSSYRPSV